jgi:hypothetical protein
MLRENVNYALRRDEHSASCAGDAATHVNVAAFQLHLPARAANLGAVRAAIFASPAPRG